MKLMANAVGRRAAERFRARFGLSTVPIESTDLDYGDVHDYVHTLLGALPGPWEDEWKVLHTGAISCPRGLDLVTA
jgi:hypothetical protein